MSKTPRPTRSSQRKRAQETFHKCLCPTCADDQSGSNISLIERGASGRPSRKKRAPIPLNMDLDPLEWARASGRKRRRVSDMDMESSVVEPPPRPPPSAPSDDEEEIEREEDLVPQALEKFKKALNTQFPLVLPHVFYDAETVKEMAKKVRLLIYHEFKDKFLQFSWDEIDEKYLILSQELDGDVKKTMTEFLQKNKMVRERYERIVETAILGAYRQTLEVVFSADSPCDPGIIEEVVETEKTKARRSLPIYFERGIRPEMAFKLEEKMTQIRENLERNGPPQQVVAVQDEDEEEEQMTFEKVDNWIQEKLRDFKNVIISPTFCSSSNCNIRKSFLVGIVDDIKTYLRENNHFPRGSAQDRRNHQKLMHVITTAEEVLSHANPLNDAGEIMSDGGLAFFWALDTDLNDCLPSQRDLKAKRRLGRNVWMKNLACAQLLTEKYGRMNGTIIYSPPLLDPMGLPPYLGYELLSIQKEMRKTAGPAGSASEGGGLIKPEMLLIRLRRVWEAARLRAARTAPVI